MRRTVLLAVLALLALPVCALAAPAKISPKAVEVSPAGVATIEVANPNRHALRGQATLTAGGRTLAKRTVRLPKRSVSTITLRLGAKAQEALKAAGERATVALRLRRGRGRATTAKRTLTLRAPGAAPAQQPAQQPAPAPPAATPAPAAPVSNRWVGRMGTEGPYDDLELTVTDGQLQITKPPFVPVVCAENGGSYATSTSLELFDAPGPWTVGTDGSVEKQGVAVNQIGGSGAKPITYKVTETSATADKVTGKLGMSFFHSKYDVFTNAITFINCFGSQSFEAVPAP